MKNEVAISVKNISKTFKIPHEKITSLRGAAVSAFKKKTYEEFKALDDVSFEVKKGEFFGIIGRNGSGKSTLLKILAGIYQPDKGQIEINGRISPFLELGIGFNPELSGRDNVYLNATVLGLTKKEIDAKFDSIVKFSELERFIDQKLKNYSSGMQVRLAFSVSIHANRDILLMDEVLAVGDSNFQKKCIEIFKNYKKRGRTVVLVTHDISSVRKYCDRAMLLHQGKIEKIGDVDEVCDEYIVKNITSEAKKEIEKKEEEKIVEESREGELKGKIKNKKQMITKVKPLNFNKKELIILYRGENFFVDVEVNLKEWLEDLHLAVQIFDRNSLALVCGNNTLVAKFDCQWKLGKNRIRLELENNSLNSGDFFVKAVLFCDRYKERTIIDEMASLEMGDSFVVKKKDRFSGGGIIHIKNHWRIINDEKK